MKKKVIIFTSSGGGGHVAAAQALEQYLGDEYDIVIHYIFAGILKNFDPIYLITLGYWHSEKLYNLFIVGKWYRVLNSLYYVGKPYINLLNTKITHLIYNYLHTHKADVVISVIPFINNACIAAAEKLDIPFFLFPLDLDASHFVYNITKQTYKNFYIGLPFDTILSKKILSKYHMPAAQIFVSGAILRTDFFYPKNITLLKEKNNIPIFKPVLLLLMGSAGSHASYIYFKQLLQITQPLHIIIVLGRHKAMRSKFEAIHIPIHISVTIFGFVQDIANLMTIADLSIMKSGSLSVCEAIYSNMPMLLDASGPILKWERLNHVFVEQNGLGQSITDYRQIPQIVDSILKNTNYLIQIKQNFSKIEKKQANIEIPKFIKMSLNNKGLPSSKPLS
ncbi:MAG TPA: hypothetical protein PLU71_03850 [Candidatus Dependentiae bacterium]|nr:hypothetical protein [Candidatus Dependentiae bacterium]HRQ62965.1 hypothetical protein [Candidatus Dependentiae bacterium]